MYGRNHRLPFQVEKLAGNEKNEETSQLSKELASEETSQLSKELASEDTILQHVGMMAQLRDTVFPKVENNIKLAQEKQKQQYSKRKGAVNFSVKDGDLILRRNMLQKNKARSQDGGPVDWAIHCEKFRCIQWYM